MFTDDPRREAMAFLLFFIVFRLFICLFCCLVVNRCSCLTRFALHGLLDELLHAVKAVLVVVARDVIRRPLRRRRGGATEAADHVHGGHVRACWLQDLIEEYMFYSQESL